MNDQTPNNTRHAPREVNLAAFGKHPGWDDHMEDLGVETPELVALKRALYVDGIGGNIDGGRWPEEASDKVLPGFDHAFVQRTDGIVICGCLRASIDGKGRSRYPIVVCAQNARVSLPWFVDESLPLLEGLVSHLREAKTAAEVIESVSQARQSIRDKAAQTTDRSRELPAWMMSGEEWEHFMTRLREIGGGVGIQRLIYQIERDMAGYRTAPKRRNTVPVSHVRVPACEADPGRSLSMWTAAILMLLDPAVRLLVIRPAAGDWVDIIVGEPTPAQLYCLRAGLGAIPLVTDIPYSLDPTMVVLAGERVAMLSRGCPGGMGFLVGGEEQPVAVKGTWRILRSRLQGVLGVHPVQSQSTP